MTRMGAFLERLQSTTSLDEIQGLVVGLRDDLDLEHAIYHIVGDTGREYGALTYDPDWVARYMEKKYFRIDPVVTNALQSFGPIDWRGLDWTAPEARRLIGEAVSEGVGKQGVTVPIRGVNGAFAMFSVTSYASDRSWDAFTGEMTGDLILAGHYIHQRAAEIMGQDESAPIALSPRETDVLTLLAMGGSRSLAAEKLSISEHTLRVYVDSARQKLGAVNTIHAVAAAMTRGLIRP